MEVRNTRVALLINSFMLGGAEKLAYDLANLYLNNNIYVIIISMAPIETDLQKKVVCDLQKKGIVTTSINKKFKGDRIKSLLMIREILSTQKIDILHTNGQSPDFYGRLACFNFNNCKVLVTIHNTNGYSKIIERVFAKLTDKYVAVSPETKEYMIENLNVKKQISVILNGIDANRYYNNGYNDSQYFTILSVGRITEQKDYLGVVREMNNFLIHNNKARWIIIGDTSFDKDYFCKFSNEISAKVKDRVIIQGTVTDTEKYYRMADCFLLNSSYEGFGISFIEGIAAGLPIICHKVGVIVDIVRYGGKILLLEDDCAENHLNSIINKVAITNEQLEINRSIVEKYYSIDTTAKNYIEAYTSM